MSLLQPDYSGASLLNLMASLERGLGGDSAYAPLRALPASEVREASRVVLMLVDGLGDGLLQRFAPGLAAQRRAAITSVFPTSTAPAITTVLTGVAPARHAVTGWFMYVPELGRVMTFLPFRPRLGAVVEASPAQVVGAGSLFDRIEVEGVVVSPKDIVDSVVSRTLSGRAERRAHADLAQCMARIEEAVRAPGERRYVYAYWGMLDALSHQHGCESPAVLAHLAALERAITQLAARLSGTGTLLLVTADHGFTDVTGVARLSQHPELAACLALPLCGEPRAALCHVRPGTEARFRAYVAEHLADRFDLFESTQLVEDGWLGPGPVDPRLPARLGDFALLGRDGQVLVDVVDGERPWSNRGVHGGASEAEMRIPLLVWRC